eukprot:scaffold8455_cov104-Isochrysis_galbana.AAC.12
MAPRQLLLELEEVDMAAEKGPKRVRVDSADDSSIQIGWVESGGLSQRERPLARRSALGYRPRPHGKLVNPTKVKVR